MVLHYTKEVDTDRGVVLVSVQAEDLDFELECLIDSPYTVEEEIQNWLDDNDYLEDIYSFELI